MIYAFAWICFIVLSLFFTFIQSEIKNKYLGFKYFLILAIANFFVTYWIAFESQIFV